MFLGLTKAEWLDLLERAVWTFVEAFGAALVFDVGDGFNWKSMLIGAVGAGASAVKTYVVTYAKKRNDKAAASAESFGEEIKDEYIS